MEQMQITNINEKLAQNIAMQDAQNLLAQTQEKKENTSFIDFKMVTFALAGKDYAIDIMHVKEIAKAGRFTYVPNTEPFVLGVYNLRGEIIPILDLRIFFNIQVDDSVKRMQNLLILNIEDQIFGLVVDKIDKVIGVQKSTIQPPHPLFGDINIKYISGVVESNNRLYVLLDVMRIFSIKDSEKANEDPYKTIKANMAQNPIPTATQTIATQAVNAAVEQKLEEIEEVVPVEEILTNNNEKESIDIKFIKETLSQYKKFYVSDVNSRWVHSRYESWTKERNTSQIQSESEADLFLKDFWSPYTGQWWSKDYADEIKKILPENNAKQIVVWNPGCGKGIETYSLACILKEKYPGAIIRIYAQDIDLLNVSNASLMVVPSELANQWYGPYITQKANNEYTFSKEIKDCIMFEYHDCKNTNVLPSADIIFARDILSVCDEESQNTMINDFQEKLKGNGIIVIGENEELNSLYGFNEKCNGAVVAYIKN